MAAELRQRHTEQPPSVWTLAYDGFDPGRQGLREALCAVGNGYFVTRGALPEAEADEVHYPGTYVAGLYNRSATEIAGRTVENEDLVNVPNWLPLAFRVAGGDWFDVESAEVLEHRLELDLRQGTLTRVLRWQDQDGRRTSVVQQPAGQHEGPAPGRPGDDLHRRELVGDDASSLRPGRPGAQRGGQALPRPERPAPRACCTPARRTPRRSSCRSRPTSRTCGSPWPPAPGCSATARPSRPIGAWSGTRVRRPRARLRAGGGAAGDGGEGGRPLHLPGPGHL